MSIIIKLVDIQFYFCICHKIIQPLIAKKKLYEIKIMFINLFQNIIIKKLLYYIFISHHQICTTLITMLKITIYQ